VIILDTNIASVLISPSHRDLATILAWQRASADQDMRITAITRAEIMFGVAILPDGAKRSRLVESVAHFLMETAGLILPFGAAEADAYGAIMASRRSAGRPMGVLDAQIAATARVVGATLATRNIKDFVECGIAVVDPYAA